MIQKDIFLQGEGDAWYKRNRRYINDVLNGKEKDKVVEAIQTIGFIPKDVLEIGCCNGYRLCLLHRMYSCHCEGIDPSYDAVNDSLYSGFPIGISVGTADELGFADASFDTVIKNLREYHWF